jgi:hypothetical protein
MPTAELEPAFLAAFRTGTLTESQASEFAHRDPIELKFLLHQLAGTATGPHTPPSVIPPYAKPVGKARKKTPGAKPGHEGHCRPAPERIDRTVVHELPPCPGCLFVIDLAERLSGRVQITTDGLKAYVKAMEDGFGGDVDYAVLHKVYGPGSTGDGSLLSHGLHRLRDARHQRHPALHALQLRQETHDD